MSLFFFGNNFDRNEEIFKIFSPQIMEVYRILLVETTLESVMFYYTFSVINTMFVPCTVLLYESTAATGTLKLSTTLLSISCGIRKKMVLSQHWHQLVNFYSSPQCLKGQTQVMQTKYTCCYRSPMVENSIVSIDCNTTVDIIRKIINV